LASVLPWRLHRLIQHSSNQFVVNYGIANYKIKYLTVLKVIWPVITYLIDWNSRLRQNIHRNRKLFFVHHIYLNSIHHNFLNFHMTFFVQLFHTSH
jgi:hypothetical protein